MNKKHIILIAVSLLIVLCVFIVLNLTRDRRDGEVTKAMDLSTAVYVSGEEYVNSKYRFSVTLPKGFKAREIPDTGDGVDVVAIEDEDGDGIQIAIYSFTGTETITPEMIKNDIPDMAVENAQSIEIEGVVAGTAFLSDNPEFGGSSREVWFAYNGDVYQISTYARLDGLLRSIFSTWSFL